MFDVFKNTNKASSEPNVEAATQTPYVDNLIDFFTLVKSCINSFLYYSSSSSVLTT